MKINDELIRRLGENDPTLTSVHFSENHLEDHDIQTLSRALAQNSTLTALSIPYAGIESEGIEAFSRILAQNSSIKFLNFAGNEVEDKGIKILAKALAVNSTLTELILDANDIRNEGAADLADMLKKNTTLKTLYISNNSYIDNTGIKSLANALKMNSTLKTLGMARIDLDDKGAQYLASALIFNSSLTSLDIAENLIETRGATAIAGALISNSTLMSLDITENSEIGIRGLQAFGNALRQNGSIINLYPYNDIIDNYCRRNQRAHARAKAAVLQLTNLYVPGLLKKGYDDEYAAYIRQLNETADEVKTTIMLRNLVDRTHGDFRRSYFRKMAYELWKSRNDPIWWTPEERREAGLQTEQELARPEKRRDIQSCIQCEAGGEAKFHEKDAPTQLFCGSYCQWIKYSGAPDLRGKSPAEIVALFTQGQ